MLMYYLIPICALVVGLIIAVTGILARTISQHKLKVEQIRADAMVRAEAIRTRNQLELEKLIKEEQVRTENKAMYSDEEIQTNREACRHGSRERE